MLTRPDFEDITVTVYKEGDRSLQKQVPVRVHPSHAQSGWVLFLNRVMLELELEDIDSFHEDLGGAPVARIVSLVDGGLYFARPTERKSYLPKRYFKVCAMLRSLARKEPERYPAWPSIEKGLEAKRDLESSCLYYKILPAQATSEVTVRNAPEVSQADIKGDTTVWTMRVKQGFKCRLYRTPDCNADEVIRVLGMCTVITLSSDWGEAMEQHPLRVKKGQCKVLRMTDPQEGFVQRMPLEEIPQSDGAGNAVEAPAPTVFTTEERMEVIHVTRSILEILRTMLRRGAYFKGAAGVHDTMEVHRAALRATATLVRKEPLARVELLQCGGIDFFILVMRKFVEDLLICEYGCWTLTAFAGGGDAVPEDKRFQEAADEAGAFGVVREIVETHRGSPVIRRQCLGSLAAIVDQNVSTSNRLVANHLHETVAEDAIRRWPNDAELCCLACWVLRSGLPTTTAPESAFTTEILGDSRREVTRRTQLDEAKLGEEKDRVLSEDDNIHDRVQDKEAECLLERLLRLAQETKVRHHDNEETRKAASALVQEIVSILEKSVSAAQSAFFVEEMPWCADASSTGCAAGGDDNGFSHSVRTTTGAAGSNRRGGGVRTPGSRIDRLLREGQALGAL